MISNYKINNKLKNIKFILVNLSIFYILFFSNYILSSNKLIDIVFNFNNLYDEIIFYFEKDTSFIYNKNTNNIKNNSENIREIEFLVPLIISNKNENNRLAKIINYINNQAKDFKLNISSKATLNYLKVNFKYNLKNLYLEYSKSKEGNLIFFKFYKKDIINLINQNTNTLRWYC